MDMNDSPADQGLRENVKAFLRENVDKFPKPFGDYARPTSEAVVWQKLLIQHGYAARTVPKEYGGYGAEPDVVASAIVAEEFRRARAPTGLKNQGVSMLVPTLLEKGTPEQKLRWIAPTIRGEIVWCQGYSEPEAGSDLASLKTSAKESGDDFIINGQKIWTTTAHSSDMMFCLVRTEPNAASKHEGISYLILSMKTPGIEVRPLQTMTGDAEFNEVFFTDVRVPKTQIVGQRGQGWLVANTTLKHERATMGDAEDSASRLSTIFDLMKQETVDGVRLIDVADYRSRAMTLQGKVFALRYHGMRLLTASSKQQDLGLPNLIIKLQTSEINHQLEALAIDVLGELGLLYRDSPLSRSRGEWQRRYMITLGMIIGGGSANIQRNIISERGLGMPREPKLVSQ